MMDSILETMNSVNSANYLFDKFLLAFAWSSLSSLRISAESTARYDLTLSVMCFHSSRETTSKLLTKHHNSTCTFLLQNLLSHCLFDIHLYNLHGPVKNI